MVGAFADGGTIPERIVVSLVHPAAAILLLIAVSFSKPISTGLRKFTLVLLLEDVPFLVDLEHSSNVKRWRDGEMALRWAAAGMESARDQFRRVKGYQQLPQLAAALEAATIDEPALADVRVTA